MALIKLNVYPRQTTGKNANRRTRVAGFTPAVFYGNDRETANVQIDTTEFTRILQKSGGGALIFDLAIEGESDHPIALMRELQQHPVTDEIHHVDLFEIPRGVPVEVSVPLDLQGEPQPVKFGDAEVNQLEYSVTLSCMPREMPDSIPVDISELELNDSLYVKDITPPAGKIVDDPETQLVVIKTMSLLLDIDEEEAEDVEGAEGEEGAEGSEEGGDKDESKDDD
jgi:large subunit ribosomal protein L25